jgi:hypothetical protein
MERLHSSLSRSSTVAFIVRMAVESGPRIEAERQGKIVVSHSFLEGLTSAEQVADGTSGAIDDQIPVTFYSSEARDIAEDDGGDKSRPLRSALAFLAGTRLYLFFRFLLTRLSDPRPHCTPRNLDNAVFAA